MKRQRMMDGVSRWGALNAGLPHTSQDYRRFTLHPGNEASVYGLCLRCTPVEASTDGNGPQQVPGAQ